MEVTRIVVRARKKARIEIIPLIDVIFFLLATFVLFTLSLNRIQSMDVDLPVAKPPDSSRPPQDTKDLLVLQVSDQGNIFFNKELIDITEVPSRIDLWRQHVDVPKVLIAGDDRAKWGVTVQVLDMVRKAGIKQLSMETRTRMTGH